MSSEGALLSSIRAIVARGDELRLAKETREAEEHERDRLHALGRIHAIVERFETEKTDSITISQALLTHKMTSIMTGEFRIHMEHAGDVVRLTLPTTRAVAFHPL